MWHFSFCQPGPLCLHEVSFKLSCHLFFQVSVFSFCHVQLKFLSGFTMTKLFYSAKVEDSQNTQIRRFSDELGETHYAEGTSLFSEAFGEVEQAAGDHRNINHRNINHRNISTLAPLCNLSSSALVCFLPCNHACSSLLVLDLHCTYYLSIDSDIEISSAKLKQCCHCTKARNNVILTRSPENATTHRVKLCCN